MACSEKDKLDHSLLVVLEGRWFKADPTDHYNSNGFCRIVVRCGVLSIDYAILEVGRSADG
jgi:hypothetical protein